MNKKKNYKIEPTLKIIQDDINKNKTVVFVAGIFSFIISILVIPAFIFMMFALLNYSDLPIFDHRIFTSTSNTDMFLVSFDTVVIFYLLIVINDIKAQSRDSLSKSYILLLITIFISLLPLLFSMTTPIIVLYTISFLITVFHISEQYFKFKYEPNYFYEKAYVGAYGGAIDDPFTIEDDINRAKISIGGIFTIFSFVFFFYKQILNSIAFLYFIRDKKNISDSARLFAYILNNDLKLDDISSKFSIASKVILETIGYIRFDGEIFFCEKGTEKALLMTK